MVSEAPPQTKETTKTEPIPEPQAEVAQEFKQVIPERQQPPILADRHLEALQAAQLREQAERHIPSTMAGAAVEKIFTAQRQNEQAVKTDEETTTEAETVATRSEDTIEPRQGDGFIDYQERIVSPESTSDEAHDSEPGKRAAPEYVAEILVATYANKKAQVVSDTHGNGAPDVIETEDMSFNEAFDYSALEPTFATASTTDTAALPKTELAGQLELEYEPDVIDTYKELMALSDEPISRQSEPVFEAVTGKEASSDLVYETDLGIKTTVDFEAYIETQPEVQNSIPLEIIIDQANEQPLEQTFVQLARHLSEVATAGEQDKADTDKGLLELNAAHDKLFTLLQEIEAELPQCYIGQETENPGLQITPEMTKKLLLLLTQLGYENPRETILAFVSQFGVSFLLQSLTYFCQQISSDDRKEILGQTALQLPSNDDNARQRRMHNVLSGLVLHGVTFAQTV